MAGHDQRNRIGAQRLAGLARQPGMAGPRRKANGLGIYWTSVISGGEQGKDPDTQQPLVRATLSLIGTTQVIPS